MGMMSHDLNRPDGIACVHTHHHAYSLRTLKFVKQRVELCVARVLFMALDIYMAHPELVAL